MFTRLIIGTLVILLIGCATSPTPTPMPTATPVPPTATAIPTKAPTVAPTNTPIPQTATRVAPTNTPASSASALKGDALIGAKVFSRDKVECDSCHDVSKPFPGGEYAPNLANIVTRAEQVIKAADHKGKAKTTTEYIRESISDPNAYIVPDDAYREKDGTSSMAQHGYSKFITPQDVEDLTAYLLTLGKPVTSTSALKGDPIAGAKWFIEPKIGCDSCHDVTKPFPGGEVAPNLGNIATDAERVIKLPNYTGKAKTVAEYLRESILTPNVFLVPGDNYREKNGNSAMEQRFAEFLTSQQVEDLIAYLLTLK